MFRLKHSIHVNAPIERCFLLSTSIALVEQTLKMHPVKGKTTGADRPWRSRGVAWVEVWAAGEARDPDHRV